MRNEVFPGEPHLRVIIMRAAISGAKGVEVRPHWNRPPHEEYVGGDDYELLHRFGYLSDLKPSRAFPGSTDDRLYAHLTPRGRLLLDWAAGKRIWSVPGADIKKPWLLSKIVKVAP